MKILLTSLVLGVSLLFTSCVSTMPFVNAIVTIASSQYLKKHPSKVGQVLSLAALLESAAKVTDKTLTKADFVSLVREVDVSSEWLVLAPLLYDVYEKNVVIPGDYAKHKKTLLDLASALRDSTFIVEPVVIATK